jgi:hypothetical protein
MPYTDEDGEDRGEPRADETLGIDRSEQAGLGGEPSVLEEYGVDTVPDDLPEPPEAPLEAPFPGSDPDLPRDLEVAEPGPDPTLPEPGHELKPGISRRGDAPLKRPDDLREILRRDSTGDGDAGEPGNLR